MLFKKNKIRISFLVVVITAIVVTTPSAYAKRTMNTPRVDKGSLKSINVGIYWDPSCSSEVHFIDWGDEIEAGSSQARTIFIKNCGTKNTKLSLDTANWNPSTAPHYVTLDWNYKGRPLRQEEIIEVELILTVNSNTEISNFSLDIIISGSG